MTRLLDMAKSNSERFKWCMFDVLQGRPMTSPTADKYHSMPSTVGRVAACDERPAQTSACFFFQRMELGRVVYIPPSTRSGIGFSFLFFIFNSFTTSSLPFASSFPFIFLGFVLFSFLRFGQHQSLHQIRVL